MNLLKEPEKVNFTCDCEDHHPKKEVTELISSAREELLNNAWCVNCGNLVMRGLVNKCRCSTPSLHVSIEIINSVLGDGK